MIGLLVGISHVTFVNVIALEIEVQIISSFVTINNTAYYFKKI
jgi:hypothetical protein